MSEELLEINKCFDQVYLLNLDRRPDRLDKVSQKLLKLNIKFKRFSAVDGNSLEDIIGSRSLENKFALACLLSHIEIIKDAKLNNFKKILIIEDDVLISEKFNEHLQKIKSLNDDWKMLYFGCSQYNPKNLKFIDNRSRSFYFCKESLGTFFYAIRSDVYDEIINQFEELKNKNALVSIDLLLSRFIQPKIYNKCFCMYPNIVIADVSESDIRGPKDLENHKKRMKWDIIKDFF